MNPTTKTTWVLSFFSFLFLVTAGCTTLHTKADLLDRSQKIMADQEMLLEKEIINQPLHRLPDREKLSYSIKYLGMTVAKAIAEIKGIVNFNGRPTYHFELTAQTHSFFDKIYPIRDRFVCYMDVEHLYTVRHEEYRREGKYQKDAIVEYDQANHIAHYEHLINGEKRSYSIPINVQGGLCAVYYFRMLSFELGSIVDYDVNINNKNYDLYGLIESIKKIKVQNIGYMDAFVMQPYADLSGERVKKGKITGYFTTNRRRIPLRADVHTPLFGSAKVLLQEIQSKSIIQDD